VPDDFDRYIYEALVRSRYQSVETIYPIIKHESPRAEASAVLDSPTHLRQLLPLYAIRPTYVDVLSLVSRSGFSIQQSINLVSALSFFRIAIVLLPWTCNPLYCALLLITPAVLVIGRLGTPDALSALIVIAAFWALTQDRLVSGMSLLILSLWIRSDNALLVIAAIGWLVWKRKLPTVWGSLLALLDIAMVLFIHHEAGNYGWAALFRYSFVGGKYPAEMPSHVSMLECVRAFATGLQSLGPQLAPWILLGIVAWRKDSRYREILTVVVMCVVAHFLLYPSPEGRYFVWAYLLTGIACINSTDKNSDKAQ